MLKITVAADELKSKLDIITFISKDSYVLKNKKASSDSAISAIFTAKKGKLIIESANEGVSYIKTVVDAIIEKEGKCAVDIEILSSFNFRSNKVILEETKNQILLSSGRMKASINKRTDLTDLDDSLPEEKIKTSITLPTTLISKALDYTIFSSIDLDMEASLPFILSTSDDRKVYASSLDHFCTSLYKVKGFKEDIKSIDMKCIPEVILKKIIKSAETNEIQVGFSESQFIIETKNITIMYPQPQYDIADVKEAVKALYEKKLQLEFEFNPEELYYAMSDVSAIGDNEAKLELQVSKDNKKIVCKIGDSNGEAKSFSNIKNVKGDVKSVSLVYNIIVDFIAHLSNITKKDCVFSLHKGILLVRTKNKSIIYTMPSS